MKKNHVFFLPIPVLLTLEQSIAFAFDHFQWGGSYGIFLIDTNANTGVIGGLLSDWLKSVHQIPLMMAGVLLLSLLYFIQFLAPIRSSLFRFGISLFFAGIICNILARLWQGYVLDYLAFQWGPYQSPFFNLADFVQMIGILLMFVLQFSDDAYDPDHDDKIWVSPQFQKRYVRQLLKIGLSLVMLFMVFGFLFVQAMSDRFSLMNLQRESLLVNYFVFSISTSACFMILLFFAGRHLSSYIVRPILHFEDYLRNLAKGDYQILFIEETEFSYLEGLSDQVRDHLVELKSKSESRSNHMRRS